MEDIYFLNEDCIHNFSFANYFIYFDIVCSSKLLSNKLKYISSLQVDKSYAYRDKNKCILNKLHLFPNLTFINTENESIDLSLYRIMYIRKYNRDLPLKILKCIWIDHVGEIILFTNLVSLNISSPHHFSCKRLDYFSKLTCLKLKLRNYQGIHKYKYCSNLRILSINGNKRTFDTDNCMWNHDKYINLQKLTLTVSGHLAHNVNLKLNLSSLTFLKLSYQHYAENLFRMTEIKYKLMIVTLNDNMTKLIRLNLFQINIENLENCLKRNIKLNTLMLGDCPNIILSNEYNYNLKHIFLQHISHITLNNMTNLITKKLYNIKRLKIDNYSDIELQ